jgi:hypothetical protein
MPLHRVRSLLARPFTPQPHGDWDLMRDAPPANDALMPAAVLMAISDEPEPQLLFTRRSAQLRRHAGQVAFPGGRQDAGDDGPIAAALRERLRGYLKSTSLDGIVAAERAYDGTSGGGR